MSHFNGTLESFQPAAWAPGGHLQTIVGYYLSRPKPLLAECLHKIALGDGDTLVMLENKPSVTPRGIILLLHGLGSDAEAPYLVRTAHQLLKNNWLVLRLNHRGAGCGRGLAKWLYHSGRSEDVSAALVKAAEIKPNLPLVAVGYSLSGNMLLKLLGEQAQQIPKNLCGAIAVNPPIDLSLCARALRKPGNKIYDIRFVRMLKDAMRQRLQDFPDFPDVPLRNIRTLYAFDEHITAPLANFASAEDYYARCNAKQFLGNLSISAIIIASDDDPFIPMETFTNLPQNDFLQLKLTRSGGHVGFIHARQTPLGGHHWLDYAIFESANNFLNSKDMLPQKIRSSSTFLKQGEYRSTQS